MALRLREKLTLKVSVDSAEQVQFFDNLEDPGAELINDELTQENDGTFSVAFGVQETISFGDIAVVKYLHIEADGDFDLSIDGGADVRYEARARSTTGSLARYTGTVAPTTSVQVTNPAASGTLTGRFVVAGDLAP